MYWAERRDENGNAELIHTIKKEGTKYTKNRDSQYRKYFLQANLTWKAMLNDEHRISALIHYEMSDSKNTKDLNKDGMAAIPLRYQGLSRKSQLWVQRYISARFQHRIYRFRKL